MVAHLLRGRRNTLSCDGYSLFGGGVLAAILSASVLTLTIFLCFSGYYGSIIRHSSNRQSFIPYLWFKCVFISLPFQVSFVLESCPSLVKAM